MDGGDRREALICLVVGAVLMYLTGHAVYGAVAAWLFTPLMVRFTRLSRPWRGFTVVAVVQALIVSVMLRGELPVPGPEYAVMVVLIGVFGGLILLVDRVLSPRLGPVLGTLVLPSTGVAFSFLTYGSNPFGTWGETAYTQLGFAPFAQFAAVTGVWGLAFLMSWFAAVANLVRERGWEKTGGRVAIYGAVAIFVFVFGYGFIRLSRPIETASTVQVAAITWDRGVQRAFSTCPRDDAACFRSRTDAVREVLFERSAAAVQAGARLVLWSEGAAEILAPGEQELLERGRAFAREHGVTLVMALAVIPVEPGLWENKLVAITHEGGIAWEYHKSRPVPGEPVVAGDGIVPVLDTPFGRIAAVICFDADFPKLVVQAGRNGADLLLVAANDWEEVADAHARMAVFRAVENGVSLIRSTSNGWSVAADAYGRILARSDHAAEELDFLLATVPVRGEPTPYVRTGDLAGWFSTGFLILAGLMVSFRSWRGRRFPQSEPQPPRGSRPDLVDSRRDA